MAEIVVAERLGNGVYSKLHLEMVEPDGTVLSQGTFTYTTSSFGQNNLKTLLAGGIKTPVQYRRGGNVRRMFEYMHSSAAEEETAVALLHPFSFSYYQKFGYEKVSDHLIIRFPTRMIDFVPRCCNFVPYDKSKFSDLVKIYTAFSRGRNLLLGRYDDSFYSSPGKHVYICYRKEEPIAYIVYSTSQNLMVNHYVDSLLTVHELGYTSPEALREIFSFLRMFEGEFDEIEFTNASPCPEVDLLLRHYTHTSYTVLPDIMAKVLNSEKILAANSYPIREGEFSVQIVDGMPSVAGTFTVSYGGGSCAVKRSDQPSDIILTAGAFTRLLYGYDGVNADTARYMEGVQIEGRAEDFFRAFPKRPCGIYEHF